MESRPFGTGGEQTPAPSEGGGPDKPDKDKKGKKSSRESAKSIQEPLFEKKTEVAKDAGETIWQRMGLEEEKPAKKAAESPDEKSSVKAEKPAEENKATHPEDIEIQSTTEAEEQAPETDDDADAEVLVDHLSTLEEHEVASDYIDLRGEALQQEQQDAHKGTEYAGAIEANQELVSQMKKELDNAGTDESLSDVLDRAERPMAERLEAAIAAAAEQLPVNTPAELGEPSPLAEAASVPPVAERPTVIPDSLHDALSPPLPPDELARQTAMVEAPSRVGAGQWGSPRGESRGWYPSLAPWDNDLWQRDFPHYMRHRRERIKGEKRVKAVERQLHKEVLDVQSQVAGREVEVRRLAAEQVRMRQQQEVVKHAPEATPPSRAEHASVSEGSQQRTVESLTHKELLRESAGIRVSGVTLRAIYEAKRVGEPGLRRLVAEYYRGGDMQLRLAEEMVEHERTFERDPLLREGHPMYEWLRGGSQAQGGGRYIARQPNGGSAGSQPASSAGSQSAMATSPAAPSKPRRSEPDPILATLVVALIIIVVLIYVVLR